MQIDRLDIEKNSKIVIAPYSPNAKALRQHLEKEFAIQFVSYLDKTHKDDQTNSYELLPSLDYDQVLIYSPNHSMAIHKTLKRYTNKMQFVFLKDTYFYMGYKKVLIMQAFYKFQDNIMSFFNKYFKKYISNKKFIMCISPDFVDNNIKDFYITCEESKEYKLILATDNSYHKSLFQEMGFNVIIFPSIKFVFYSVVSHIKVVDHTPSTQYLKNSLINSKKIQLWHGIPLKAIGKFADYKQILYDVVLTTSPFVTDYAFSKVFHTKKFVESNYPRNEVFFEKPLHPKRLVLVDKKIYEFCQKTDLKVIVYMPTYRNSNVEIPIDYDDLENFAKANNLFFIIKLHPFVMQKMRENQSIEIKKLQNYQNICFYPDGKDIYPILPLSKMLITDYSSVYFDYLFLDKPILFFVYDLDTYEKDHGKFMIDFEEFTPGDKVKDYGELKNKILGIDSYQEHRKKMLNIFYTKIKKDKLFYTEIKNL